VHHNIIPTSIALAVSTEIEREAAATATFQAEKVGELILGVARFFMR
jgi:hypothetical protein